jgi:hypothetical protein
MKMTSVGLTLLAIMCLAMLATACEEDEEEATATPAVTATAPASPTAQPQTPSPAATPALSPTPQRVACPDDDPNFCTFAARVDQAIANEAADFFVAHSLTESVLCTAEAADVGYFCGPEEIGQTITGVLYGREASEGSLVPPDLYRDLWTELFAADLTAEEDSEGSGELHIWGLAYPAPPAEGTARNIVLTYISDSGMGPERQAISLNCELAEGRWQIKSLLQHILALGSPKDTSAEWRDWPE